MVNDMQDKINKIIWSIIPILILIFIFLFIYNNNSKKDYTRKIFYMDTYIYVKLYDINKKDIVNALANPAAIAPVNELSPFAIALNDPRIYRQRKKQTNHTASTVAICFCLLIFKNALNFSFFILLHLSFL